MAGEDEFYLYRVEEYLIHKYRPDLIEEFKVSFARARAERAGVLKQNNGVIATREELLMQIQNDLTYMVRWKPKNSDHSRKSYVRPGISSGYQERFEEL